MAIASPNRMPARSRRDRDQAHSPSEASRTPSRSGETSAAVTTSGEQATWTAAQGRCGRVATVTRTRAIRASVNSTAQIATYTCWRLRGSPSGTSIEVSHSRVPVPRGWASADPGAGGYGGSPVASWVLVNR